VKEDQPSRYVRVRAASTVSVDLIRGDRSIEHRYTIE
jgi:hypothetical protein